MLAILQVAIGICFVFLLFSLIVSAGNELVQALLSMRAAQLRAGLGELLQDRKFQNAAKEFCNHPLISCLSKGADGQPSYIAPGIFVITVLDLLREGQIVVGGAKGSDLAAQIAGIQNPELRRALSSIGSLTFARPDNLPMKVLRGRSLKPVSNRTRECI